MTDVIQVKKYNEGITGDEMLRAPRVVRAMQILADIKRQEQELKHQKEASQDVIAEFHFNQQVRDFTAEGVGSVSAYLGQSTRFDKTVLALRLVELGVDASVVEDAIDHATTKKMNSKVTVRFSLPK